MVSIKMVNLEVTLKDVHRGRLPPNNIKMRDGHHICNSTLW